MSEVLVVGSVGYDSISTPTGQRENILGGSANYFSLAASHYGQVNVVGVVGDDYEESDKKLLLDRNVDLSGLQQIPGKTFHWEGKYENDMNEAITLDTQLNVFENFDPQIPEKYKSSAFLFLANIDPILQMQVLDQVKSPKFVGVDTMNYWISSKLDELKNVLQRVDVLLINEGEARELTGLWNGVAAARELSKMGPRGVVIKRGEYGFLMYAEDQYFILPAFPVTDVVDPTGAGDTFAGGFFGYLSKVNQEWSLNHLKQACVHGCLMASFTVESFGVESLVGLSWSEIEARHSQYRAVITNQ